MAKGGTNIGVEWDEQWTVAKRGTNSGMRD